MIALQSVSKHFQHRGKPVAALDNVTLEIAKGDFVAIIGPSGSGKSTFLHLLGGMLSPTEGKVRIDERLALRPDLGRSAPRCARRRSASCFRPSTWCPISRRWKTCRCRWCWPGSEEDEQKAPRGSAARAESACPTGWTTSPRELSVGQQQRVALARMLANDPALILADEPTGNLDPETSASIMDFLDELNGEGRTIVMVTHDLRLAARAKRCAAPGGRPDPIQRPSPS